MKKIIEFLSTHGMMVMLSGFFLSICGVIILAFSRNQPWGSQLIRTTSITISIIGLAVYLLGRIFLEVERRNKRKTPPADVSPKDDDL